MSIDVIWQRGLAPPVAACSTWNTSVPEHHPRAVPAHWIKNLLGCSLVKEEVRY